jgi:hypothetical protein
VYMQILVMTIKTTYFCDYFTREESVEQLRDNAYD